MKYFRRFKEVGAMPEEVSKEKALDIIGRNYKKEAVERLLEGSSVEYPVNTMFAYYWKEAKDAQ